MFEGLGYVIRTNVKGQARAFDVADRQAAVAVQHASRSRGEFGHDTWENESWA